MGRLLTNDVFKFVRNVISHFPLFDSWDQVWISRSLVNWNKSGQSIDTFLMKHCGKKPLGFAYKDDDAPEGSFPTLVDINFPLKYDDESKIFLKDLISEKEGIIFSIAIMMYILPK